MVDFFCRSCCRIRQLYCPWKKRCQVEYARRTILNYYEEIVVDALTLEN
jgi:hypothetical protein